MKRFLAFDRDGSPAVDESKIKEEERLDGKYLFSTSSPDLGGQDVALGYGQLLEVERAFRTLRTPLDLRPVYHSRDDRIRSHVLLCRLALLLVRLVEIKTGCSWTRVRAEMERLHLVELKGQAGYALKRTELTDEQRRILRALESCRPGPSSALSPAAPVL